MKFRPAFPPLVSFILLAATLLGCSSTPQPTAPTPLPSGSTPTAQATLPTFLAAYAFPAFLDPASHYMFYLHGQIIEDEGIPAISPEFGEYEYEAILNKLASHDFVVISELRPINTDALEYAEKVVGQINQLLDAGVPAQSITVVGASKGASIAIFVSYLLENTKTNFVLLGTCHPDMVENLVQNQISLYGNVLAIYDSTDLEYSGSCADLFAYSESKGIGQHDEIVLHVGTGHGILYKPLDEWVLPSVQWAKQ
jgi:hypothetical protein